MSERAQEAGVTYLLMDWTVWWPPCSPWLFYQKICETKLRRNMHDVTLVSGHLKEKCADYIHIFIEGSKFLTMEKLQ